MQKLAYHIHKGQQSNTPQIEKSIIWNKQLGSPTRAQVVSDFQRPLVSQTFEGLPEKTSHIHTHKINSSRLF